MVVRDLEREMRVRGITLYRLSKMTGIRYELLRRSFHGARKLTAEELVLILDKTGIDYAQVKQ